MQKDDKATFRPRSCEVSKLGMLAEEDTLTENIKQTGSNIKVLWSAAEVGDSGLKQRGGASENARSNSCTIHIMTSWILPVYPKSMMIFQSYLGSAV